MRGWLHLQQTYGGLYQVDEECHPYRLGKAVDLGYHLVVHQVRGEMGGYEEPYEKWKTQSVRQALIMTKYVDGESLIYVKEDTRAVLFILWTVEI